MSLASTVLPGWLVIPLAGIILIVIARHVLSVQVSPMDAWHKSLRISNGILMMLVATMLAYALGIAPAVIDPRAQPAEARGYVMVWSIIVALLTIVIILALADALGTARDALRARRELRAELARTLRPGCGGDKPRA